MKNLLLLINLFFLFASCQNKINAQKDSLNESQSLKTDSITIVDSTREQKQISPSGTVGKTDGQTKDSTKTFSNPTVIIHNAPNQEQIDSIKQAKKKLKK